MACVYNTLLAVGLAMLLSNATAFYGVSHMHQLVSHIAQVV